MMNLSFITDYIFLNPKLLDCPKNFIDTEKTGYYDRENPRPASRDPRSSTVSLVACGILGHHYIIFKSHNVFG